MVLRRSTTDCTWLSALRNAPRSTLIFMGRSTAVLALLTPCSGCRAGPRKCLIFLGLETPGLKQEILAGRGQKGQSSRGAPRQGNDHFPPPRFCPRDLSGVAEGEAGSGGADSDSVVPREPRSGEPKGARVARGEPHEGRESACRVEAEGEDGRGRRASKPERHRARWEGRAHRARHRLPAINAAGGALARHMRDAAARRFMPSRFCDASGSKRRADASGIRSVAKRNS
jgi:hypothetical protein